MPTEAVFQLAMCAFDVMTLDERERVLTTMMELEYPSMRDRFNEAIYQEIRRQRPLTDGPTRQP